MMARCIELARTAAGRTNPNPLVGAVVVNDAGEIIAEGFHAKAGEAHAEVVALEKAGDSARGATLYVSLEPCCHHGKTPPCSDRVIGSGVKRVVCGLVDPNPKVAGGGIKALRSAGIDVMSGVLEEECRYLNRGFLKWMEKRTPWVILKLGVTLDAKIADRNYKSRWVTGPEARQFVQQQRNEVDCVMIGGATAYQDNAELTVRDIENSRNPIRAIVDTDLKFHRDCKLAQNPDGKTWVFAKEEAIELKSNQFGENVRLIATPSSTTDGAKLDLQWILQFLGNQKIQTVMCEGGGRLAGSLLDRVDEIYWIVAPKFMHDKEAIPAVELQRHALIDKLQSFRVRRTEQLGNDVLINLLR